MRLVTVSKGTSWCGNLDLDLMSLGFALLSRYQGKLGGYLPNGPERVLALSAVDLN